MSHGQAEHARAEELADAFGLLFSRLGRRERDYRVEKALALVRQGGLDPAGVFVVRGDGGLAGVMACAPVPGAGGVVWPPTVVPAAHQALYEAALIEAACGWLRRRGAKLAQALLAPDELPLAHPLLANGFEHVTWLAYLDHDLTPPPASSDGRALTVVPYDPSAPAVFHNTLARTFDATLDCPEVNGVRSVEEVIEGHRAQGPFDPSRWWLARDGGQPVGVLILIDLEEAAGWEVAYTGVVPEARRRGVGRALMLRAVRAARAAQVRRLTLSVDERNRPAHELYTHVGFRPAERRAVLLRVGR